MEAKIFDTLLEPVFVLNAEKKVLYCNEPAALLCEISVRKIMRGSFTFDELFKFQGSIENLNSLDQVADATPYQEISFSADSGKTGKVQITFQPFTEMNGAKTWIVFFRDVTLEETLQKKYRAELEQKEDVILDLQKAQAELEQYSKNLEKMVDERTAEIKKLNSLMTALLDSLHQGFFVFDSKGLCLEVFSKACESTVQTRPAGKMIWDVLKLPAKQVPGFQKWMGTLFSEMLPFPDLSPLGPQKFPHSENLEVQLEYYPLRAADGRIDGVVVVASDITNLVAAQKEAETERAHAKMILSLIQHRRQVLSFLQESESILAELKKELAKGESSNPDNLFRCLHTLKGGAASFSIKKMAEQAHESESLLTQWKSEKTAQQWTALFESSMQIEKHFQDFSIENEQILGSKEKLTQRWVEIPAAKLAQFQNRLPLSLQDEFAGEFLMEPIGEFFKQYNEVVMSVAEREMKSILPLTFQQTEIPVLPEIYSQLFSTFIHAYRNAVDHGIENPSRRQELGKPTEGKIETSFSVETDQGGKSWLQIEVKDDGGGIDAEKIRAKLTAQGKDVSQETDLQVIQHIFDSQFSTKEVVTETSGRGVGMDAILYAAKALGGTAWVNSIKDSGTSLKIRVPYQATTSRKPVAA